MNLYPGQIEANERVKRSLRIDNPTLLVAPTGAGKTHMAADIAMDYQRVLFVAPRREIAAQAKLIMPAHVTCMTTQEASLRGPKEIDLLILDEAHHSPAPTIRRLIRRYRSAVRMGLTATPMRADGQGLCGVFDEIVQYSSVRELIEQGLLVPFVAHGPSGEAREKLKELKKIKKCHGDYATGEASKVMSAPRLVSEVVREYKRHGNGRRAVVFAVSIQHSKLLTAAFISAGIRAAHLDGLASPKHRAARLLDLSEGRIDVLCNVSLFTEGWDCPSVSCVIMARPTLSDTLYRQSIGRGLRTSPGKTDLLILDHADNIHNHGAPDEPGEISLESAKQRAAREAVEKKLEVARSFNFGSIEEYELEEARKIAERYSCRTVASLMSPWCARDGTGSNISYFLKRFKIKPVGGSKNGSRYLRSDIDLLISHLLSTYSTGEVQIIGVKPHSIPAYLRKRGILPFGEASRNRYLKSDIDRLTSILNASLVTKDAMTYLHLGPDSFRRTKKNYSLVPCDGGSKSHGTRYLKSDIYRIAEEMSIQSPSVARNKLAA